jgi:DNA-binding Lrp family transcriptional regulator
MDELDVRIFRALISNKVLFSPLKYSLREVARMLQVDHLTVRNRFRRFQEEGFLSGWQVLPNPGLFGYSMTNILVEMPSKAPKEDVIRKLKLIHGVVQLVDLIGNSIVILLFYDSEQSLSRTVELISRIANAENVTQVRMSFSPGMTNHFSETDWAIIGNLENNALKTYVQVAREVGLTPRTVKNRLQRLEHERALIVVPAFDIARIDGMIGLFLFYTYTSHKMKSIVDQAVLSHFDGCYLWVKLSDLERAFLVLVAPTMASVKSYLEWTKQHPGVASAGVGIAFESFNLWSKTRELFQRRTFLDQSSRRSLTILGSTRKINPGPYAN